MFQKMVSVLSVAVAVSMASSSMVLAAPTTVKTVDGVVKEVAGKTGKSEKEVREEAIKTLRESKQFSEADLARIGHEAPNNDVLKIETKAAEFLKKGRALETRVNRLAAVRNSRVEAKAVEGFKTENEGVAKKKGETGLEKEARAREFIKVQVSAVALESALSVSPKNLPLMRKWAAAVAHQVKVGGIKRELAEKLIIDISKTPEALDGELVISEQAPEACVKMKEEALSNYDQLVQGGLEKGRNPVEFTKGMAEKADELFPEEAKKGKNKGLERVCAIANAECGMFGKVIANACKNLRAAAL